MDYDLPPGWTLIKANGSGTIEEGCAQLDRDGDMDIPPMEEWTYNYEEWVRMSKSDGSGSTTKRYRKERHEV